MAILPLDQKLVVSQRKCLALGYPLIKKETDRYRYRLLDFPGGSAPPDPPDYPGSSAPTTDMASGHFLKGFSIEMAGGQVGVWGGGATPGKQYRY